MKIHELKTWVAPFQAVWDGLKTYEIRLDDRCYEAGDVLVLREYFHNPGGEPYYLDRAVLATVRYITSGGRWGLKDGHIVMSIDVYRRVESWVEGHPIPMPPGITN